MLTRDVVHTLMKEAEEAASQPGKGLYNKSMHVWKYTATQQCHIYLTTHTIGPDRIFSRNSHGQDHALPLTLWASKAVCYVCDTLE